MKVLIFSGTFRRGKNARGARGGRALEGRPGMLRIVADNTGYFPVFVGPAGGFPGEFEALMFPDISGLSRDNKGYSAGFFEGGR